MPIAKSRSHFQFGGWAKFSMPPISAIFPPIFLLHCAGAFVSSALQLELCLEWAALVAKKLQKLVFFFCFCLYTRKKQNPNLILNTSELELNEWKTRALPKRFFNAMHFADYYCSLLFLFFIYFFFAHWAT